MRRKEILERLEEIADMTEKLTIWREGFQEHISYIDFELKELHQERHYLVEKLLSKPILTNNFTSGYKFTQRKD